ncbi:hypothetical protein BGZ76_000964 [Entomortierella beljakovae]|nr:hypothetical protein BGZ76_000964 [Entomortierella beljakovae]
MSSTSSCNSSPFSSPETGADLDFLDMPMPIYYANDSSIYQQLFDMNGSSELSMQSSYQSYSPQQQKQQQPIQFAMPQHGLGTPPTSPSPSFYKYSGVNEAGSMFYGLQQVIQNAYVNPTQPLSVLQQNPLLLLEARERLQQEQLTYLLMQQGDNIESSLFSSSPTISSLSSSPFSDSPPMPIVTDFDLFPKSNSAVQHVTTGFPSAPVMAPSASQAAFSQSGIYHQMTPPMNHMDIMQESASLFKQDLNTQQPLTTEMSLLCNCPGKFPCGEQLGDNSIESSSCSASPSQEVHDHEHESSESDSEEEQQYDEDQQESDPSYTPTRKGTKKGRSKSMTLSISTTPYNSPYSKDTSSSPKTPVRKDRRKSSGGSPSSRSHNQQLLEPEMVPEIKDVHVCPVCQRRFTRPFNLRSHLMTHTTARPFPCDECHWKFTRQHDLLRHKRAKHPNSVNSAGQKNDSANTTIADA